MASKRNKFYTEGSRTLTIVSGTVRDGQTEITWLNRHLDMSNREHNLKTYLQKIYVYKLNLQPAHTSVVQADFIPRALKDRFHSATKPSSEQA